jgi:hypothetical protein
MMKILILYYSKTGHTLEAANATAEGIRSAGSEVNIVAVSDFKASSVADYDGIIVGSPCWAGSITGKGVAGPVTRAMNSLPVGCLKSKRCGGLSIHAKAGGQNTVMALGKLLSLKGCTDYRPGPVAQAGTPFSVLKGTSVSAEDAQVFNAYGATFIS